MGDERKKITRFMGIVMSVTISSILGTMGTILSGHFSLPAWGASLLLSNVLGLIITFAIPVRKLSERISESIINKFIKLFVDALITNLFYAPIITVCMIFSMSFVVNNALDIQVATREEQIVKVEDSLKALESTGLQNGRIENYEKQIKELENEIKGINEGRPNPKETLLKTIISSYILSVVLTMIAQPLWLKLAFRKYLNLR